MTRGASRSRKAVAVAVALQLALSGPVSAADSAPAATVDDAAIIHVLNRLTFGASARDIEEVKKTGLAAWIDAQLAPAASPDKALAEKLAAIETLSMSTAELREKYEIPPNVRQEIQKVRAEREAANDPDSPIPRPAEREEMMKRFPELARMGGRPQQVIAGLQAAKILRAVYAERQLEEVMVDFWFNHFNVFARKGPIEYMVGEYERTIRANAFGKFEDLLVATAKSPAMLFYLDNWQSTDPNFDPRALRAQQRGRNRRPGAGGGGIAPRRPGRPAETMEPGGMASPAEATPSAQTTPAMTSPQPPRRTFGINENYARELMELHTLGVDGGYTQADVVEVAKAFTGWTILGEGPGGPRQNKESRFGFEDARHVKGDKKVLSVTIKNGGEKEGLEILRRLAAHPKTASFIARKLVRRFVADTPPPALVQRAAAAFEKTGGDIREVVRVILKSDEFLGPSFRAAKVKTPLEFVVSTVRVTGAEVRQPRDLVQRIADMGMPLYLQQPPTGYKDTAEEWISTSSLLARMNFALDLAGGGVRGVRLDASNVGGPSPSLDSVAARLLPGGLSENSRKTLESEANKPGSEPTRVVGLVLGSPEFQRR